MTKLTLSRLLSLHLHLFTATEDLLGTVFSVEDDTEGRRHVTALHIVIVVEILAAIITFVTVNEIDFILLSRFLPIDKWHVVWLFDGAEPWLACHELVTNLGRFNKELVVTGELLLTLFAFLGLTSFLLFFGLRIQFLTFEF